MSKNNNTEKRLMLDCVDWCFEISDLTLSNFQHKCFSGYCYVRPRKSNPKKGNVYGIGHVLLGLLREKDYQDYLDFADLHTPIECFLDKKHSTINRYMKFSTLCVREKTLNGDTVPKNIKRKRGSPSLLNFPEIPVTPRAKHLLTGLAFAPKRNIKFFCKSLKGKCGVYCIYSKDFTTYIGQSIDVGKRLNEHVRSLRSGRHSNTALQSAWKILGQNGFTFHLIEECKTEILDERERYFIEKYNTYAQGYNQTPDGQGTYSEDSKIDNSHEWLEQISLFKKEDNIHSHSNEYSQGNNDSTVNSPDVNLNQNHSKEKLLDVWVDDEFQHTNEHQVHTFLESISEENDEVLKSPTTSDLIELRNKLKKSQATTKTHSKVTQNNTSEMKQPLPDTVAMINIQTSFQELHLKTHTKMFVMSRLLNRITGLKTQLYRRYQRDLQKTIDKYKYHCFLFSAQERKVVLAQIKTLNKNS